MPVRKKPDLSFLPDQDDAAQPDLSFLPDKEDDGTAPDLSFLPDQDAPGAATPGAPPASADGAADLSFLPDQPDSVSPTAGGSGDSEAPLMSRLAAGASKMVSSLIPNKPKMPTSMGEAVDTAASPFKVKETMQNQAAKTTAEALYRTAPVAAAALEAGAGEFNAALARTPNLINAVAALPVNMALRAAGKPEIEDPKYFEKEARWWQDQAAKVDPGKKRWLDKGENLVTIAKRGDAVEAGEYLAYQVLKNSPQQAMIVGASLMGMPGFGLGIAGTTTAASSLAEGRELGAAPTSATMNAVLSGTIEAAFENLGTAGQVEKWSKVLGKSMGSSGPTKVVKTMLKGLYENVITEAGEEFWTSLAQDLSKVITGVDPNAMKGSLARAVDAGGVGGASALGTTAPASIASHVAQMAEDAPPTKLDQPTAEVLTQKYPALAEQVMGAAAQVEIPNLPDVTKQSMVAYEEAFLSGATEQEATQAGVEEFKKGAEEQTQTAQAAEIEAGKKLIAEALAEPTASAETPAEQSQPDPALQQPGALTEDRSAESTVSELPPQTEGQPAPESSDTAGASLPVHPAFEGQPSVFRVEVPYDTSISAHPNFRKAFSDADATVREYAAKLGRDITPEFAQGIGQEIHVDFRKAFDSSITLAERKAAAEAFKKKYAWKKENDVSKDMLLLRDIAQSNALQRPGSADIAKESRFLEKILDKYTDEKTLRAAVEKSGGVWRGIQQDAQGKPDMALFNDPLSRTTLAVPIAEATPQGIAAKLKESREKLNQIHDAAAFEEAVAKAAPHISQEKIKATAQIADAVAAWWAKNTGQTKEDYYKQTFAGVFKGTGAAPGALEQSYSERLVDEDVAEAQRAHEKSPEEKTSRLAEIKQRIREIEAMQQDFPSLKRNERLNDEYVRLMGEQTNLKRGRGAPDTLHQGGKKGAVQFLENQRALIQLFEKADESTIIHELWHVARRDLYRMLDQVKPEMRAGLQADIATVEKWAGVQKGEWTRASEEKFARGFERYVATGNAPIPALQRVFDLFKDWLKNIYGAITGTAIDVDVSPEVRAVFDRMLGADSQAERAPPTSSGDIKLPSGGEPPDAPLFQNEDQTDTPAFRKWFGKSKVVDENGRPLVVYHGTTSAFTTFAQNKASGVRKQQGLTKPTWGQDLAFFFTDDPEYASEITYQNKGANVMPVYLQMVKPLVADLSAFHGAPAPETVRLLKKAKAEGHDGVIIQGMDDMGRDATQYAVFRPNQIKSATGNRGTFDPKSPNILYQEEERRIPPTVENVKAVSARTRDVTPDKDKANLTKVDGNSLEKDIDEIPIFQGGKRDLATRVGAGILKKWAESERKAINSMTDAFGGSGGWGLWLANHLFPNVKTINVNELNPDRLLKIQFFHERGNTMEDLVYEKKLRQKLGTLYDDMAKAGVQSGSALGSRLEKMVETIEDPTERAMIMAIIDYVSHQRGVRTVNDAINAAMRDADYTYKAAAKFRARGGTINYHQGDAYALEPEPGSKHVVIFDPPYYGTAGYGTGTVPMSIYKRTGDFLAKVTQQKNHVVYTDSLWFAKPVNELPRDWQQGALDVYRKIEQAINGLGSVKGKIGAGRSETVGFNNAFSPSPQEAQNVEAGREGGPGSDPYGIRNAGGIQEPGVVQGGSESTDARAGGALAEGIGEEAGTVPGQAEAGGVDLSDPEAPLFPPDAPKVSQASINRLTGVTKPAEVKRYTETQVHRATLQRAAYAAAEAARDVRKQMDYEARWKEAEAKAMQDWQVAKAKGEAQEKIDALKAKLEDVKTAAAQERKESKQAAGWIAGETEAMLDWKISEAKGLAKNAAERLQQIKQDVRDEVMRLPMSERGGFVTTILNAKTPRDIIKTIARVDQAFEKYQRRVLKQALKRQFQRFEASKAIAVDYIQKMRAVMDGILLQKPRMETQVDIERAQQFIDKKRAAGEHVSVPQYVMDKIRSLAAQPLADMSVAQIEDVLDYITTLASLGKTKLRAMQEIESTHKANDLKALSAETVPINQKELDRAKPGEDLPMGKSLANYLRRVTNIAQNTNYSITPMDVVFDIMDGSRNYTGANFRIFKARVDTRYSASLNFAKAIKDTAREVAKGLTDKDMERIGVYAAAQQKNGPEKLMNNGMTPEEIQAINPTSKELSLYQHMRRVLDALRPQIAEVMRVVYNLELGDVEHYFPFVTDWDQMGEQDFRDRMLEQMQGLRKNTERGFTKERKGAGNQKININAWDVFTKHIDDVAYLLEMGPTIKYLGDLAASDEYGAMAGNMGQRIVREWVDTVARKGGGFGDQQIKLLDFLRRNAGLAGLGLRLSTTMLQFTPILQGASLIGPRAFKGAINIAMSPRWRQFIHDHMPEVRERGGDDPAFKDFSGDTIKDKYGRMVMWPIQKGDQLAAESVASGAYEKYMADHNLEMDFDKPNPEAVAYAQLIVRRSQSSGSFKDLPQAFTRGNTLTGNISFNKALLQFQSFALNDWSLLVHDGVRAGVMKGNARQSFSVFLWAAMAALATDGMYKMLRRLMGKKEPDEEEWQQWLKAALFKVPFIGQLYGAAVYGSSGIPSLDVAVKAGKGVYRAMTSKKDTTRVKGAADAAVGISTIMGAPIPAQLADIFKQLYEKAGGRSSGRDSAPRASSTRSSSGRSVGSR